MDRNCSVGKQIVHTWHFFSSLTKTIKKEQKISGNCTIKLQFGINEQCRFVGKNRLPRLNGRAGKGA